MAKSTIADSILNILRSQEKKQETAVGHSLQAMQLNIEADRSERRLKIEELNSFITATEGISAKIEAKKNQYLQSLYSSYFSGIFMKTFKSYLEKGELDKKNAIGKLDDLADEFKEFGFSENDSEFIANSLYNYHKGGFTNSQIMQDVVNLFLDSDNLTDEDFLKGAKNAGIFSTDEESLERDIESFRRVGEYDMASVGLLAEQTEAVQAGDLKLDYNYAGFVGGEALEKLESHKLATSSTPSKAPSHAEMLAARESYTDEEWAEYFGQEGQSRYGIKGYSDKGWSVDVGEPGTHIYDPTSLDYQAQYDGAKKNLDELQREYAENASELSNFQSQIDKKILASEKGTYVYTENEQAIDSLALLEAEKAQKIYDARIKYNEKIIFDLEDDVQKIIPPNPNPTPVPTPVPGDREAQLDADFGPLYHSELSYTGQPMKNWRSQWLRWAYGGMTKEEYANKPQPTLKGPEPGDPVGGM